MCTNGGGELLNDEDLTRLEAELERLGQEWERCEEKIKELRNREDPVEGIFFAQEIFTRQQDKLRLQIEIEFCRRKKNRYLLAREEGQGL